VNGLTVNFGEANVFIPNVAGKLAGKGDLQRASGATFGYISGNLNGNVLQVSNNVTQVLQRYQAVVVLKNELGSLVLSSLSATSDWKTMPRKNSVFYIIGLDAMHLLAPQAGINAIKSAAMRAISRKRMSRATKQQWMNSIQGIRAVNQPPLSVMLQTVTWKIDGRNDKGKTFTKQVRIDIPL
jgi:hypothetical protein